MGCEPCWRSRIGGVGLWMVMMTSCTNGPAETATSETESTGGEHGHHGHHGGTDCHGRGAEGDFADAECFARMFDSPERAAWQQPDAVVALLAIAPGMTVADVGAGTGYFEGRLSVAVESTGYVLALDVEEAMVTYMTERFVREGLTNVQPRRVAFTSPGLAPASVDRVLVVDTWHHIEDRVPYAAELAAALRPEGTITIVDFTMESPEGPPVEMRLSPESVIAELATAGLRAEIVTETLPHQWVVRAAR